MFRLDLKKAEEPKIKLPTSVGSQKEQENCRNIYFYFIGYAKTFDSVDHNKLERSSRDGNTRPPYLPPEKSVFSKEATVRIRHGKRSSKLRKEYVKAVYCHSAYLTYMQSTSCEILD